jgi:hypothetical protein
MVSDVIDNINNDINIEPGMLPLFEFEKFEAPFQNYMWHPTLHLPFKMAGITIIKESAEIFYIIERSIWKPGEWL